MLRFEQREYAEGEIHGGVDVDNTKHDGRITLLTGLWFVDGVLSHRGELGRGQTSSRMWLPSDMWIRCTLGVRFRFSVPLSTPRQKHLKYR